MKKDEGTRNYCSPEDSFRPLRPLSTRPRGPSCCGHLSSQVYGNLSHHHLKRCDFLLLLELNFIVIVSLDDNMTPPHHPHHTHLHLTDTTQIITELELHETSSILFESRWVLGFDGQLSDHISGVKTNVTSHCSLPTVWCFCLSTTRPMRGMER